MLKRSDFDTATWARMAEVLRARLAESQSTLEGTSLPFDKTQVVRGRIAELKALLALPEAAQASVDGPATPRDPFEP